MDNKTYASTPDPSVRVAEIEARAKAATPGPWVMTTQGGIEQASYRGPGEVYDSVGSMRTEPDWIFASHAREDIPWLIERLHAAEAERDEAVENLRSLAKWVGVPEDTSLVEIACEVSAVLEECVVKQQCSDNLREITARDALIAAAIAVPESYYFATELREIRNVLAAAPVSVLASHDAEVAAKAWDEGLDAGRDRWMDSREFGDKPVNPYRKEQERD